MNFHMPPGPATYLPFKSHALCCLHHLNTYIPHFYLDQQFMRQKIYRVTNTKFPFFPPSLFPLNWWDGIQTSYSDRKQSIPIQTQSSQAGVTFFFMVKISVQSSKTMSDISVPTLFGDCGLLMQNSAHIIQQRPPNISLAEVIGDDRCSVQKQESIQPTSTGE